MTVDEYRTLLFEHAEKLGYSRRDVPVPSRGWTAGSPEYLHFHHASSGVHALIAAAPANPRSISSAKGKPQAELNKALGVKPKARKKQVSLSERDLTVLMEESPDRYWTLTLIRMVIDLDKRLESSNLDFEAEVASLSIGLDCACCGEPVDRRSPYCGDFCKDFANIIRRARRAASTDLLMTADVQISLGARLISLFKGGYPTKARFLSRKQREAIFERDHRICQICGGLADQIDHISGDSSAPSNLRAVCGPCNRKLAMEIKRKTSRKEKAEFVAYANEICAALASRIAAPNPVNICDDHERWAGIEPTIRAARGKLIKKMEQEILSETEEEIDDDFEDVEDYLWHAMQKDD